MNAIRKIKKVKNGKIEIDLPKDFKGKEVEVIVIINFDTSIKNQNKITKKENGKSLAGALHKYANSSLIDKESEAWCLAVKEKYGLH